MTQAPEAVRCLSERLRAMESDIEKLVLVNSFTENVDGGNAVGGLLREVFAMDGLACQRISSQRFAEHLVFHSKGREGVAPVALVGHLDTVFPPGTFEGYRRDGELARGPGVLDMKGGLVIVAHAIRAIAETVGLDHAPPLVIPIVSDEEVGSPEGQAVIRKAIAGASSALVFEAGRTRDAIITRRKGTGAVTVTSQGKAAHAGNAHKDGVNAIWALARFVDRVQALTDYARGSTVNVGVIRGGTSKNTVPDSAEAKVDLRFESREDAEGMVARFEAVAREVGEELGASIRLEGGVARLPLERTEASGQLMARYAAAARASGLGYEEAGLIGGGSDASTAHAMGIPAIDGLGPRGAGFHTADEHIFVTTLVPKAQALARFLVEGQT